MGKHIQDAQSIQTTQPNFGAQQKLITEVIMLLVNESMDIARLGCALWSQNLLPLNQVHLQLLELDLTLILAVQEIKSVNHLKNALRNIAIQKRLRDVLWAMAESESVVKILLVIKVI